MVYRCGTLAAGRAVEAYQSVDCERNVAVAELARVRRIVDAQAACAAMLDELTRLRELRDKVLEYRDALDDSQAEDPRIQREEAIEIAEAAKAAKEAKP